MAKNFKKSKYQETLLNEINSFLRVHASDSRLQFVSITKVEMTPDYTAATIFWDTFDSSKRGDAKMAVDGIKPAIRKHLSKVLTVRQVPQLKFIYDSQFEDQSIIENILKDEASKGRS